MARTGLSISTAKVRDGPNLIESAVKYGNAWQASVKAHQNSLFGALDDTNEVEDPKIPEAPEWSLPHLLGLEKEVTGIYLSGHPLEDFQLELESFCTCPVSDVQKYRSRQVFLGGMITKVQHRTSRRGNRFGSFSVEDFTGEIEIMLFGEDYLKFKHFLEAEGTPIFLTGKYQLRFRSEDEYEFKVTNMQLLNTVREERTKKITIRIPLSDLNEELVTGLEELFQSHPGKFSVGVRVDDEAAKYALDFTSRKYRVDISNELVKKVAKDFKLGYSLA